MSRILIWESLSILAGGQKVALQILDALSNGDRCLFVLPEDGPLAKELRRRGIHYYELDIGRYNIGKKTTTDIMKYLFKTPGILLRICRIISKEKIQLIYANAARSFPWSAFIGNVVSIPVVWHVHNYFSDNKSKYIISKVGKSKSVRKVLFVAHSVRRQFEELTPKASVVQNGIDISDFPSSANKSKNIEENFGISSSKRIIVTIGWIMPSKRQEVLLKAIPFILEQVDDVHFFFVGGIRSGHEMYYKELLNTAKELGIESSITFTGHRDDVPEILNKAFINVINSQEAFPLTLLEGWASGVPTIGPDIGSIPELVTNGKTGLIYDYKNPKDLSEKILILLKDERLYNKIKNFSLCAVKRYNQQRFKRSINLLVREVITC